MFSTVLLALVANAAEPEPIVVVGRPWAPFISPMGEPFRARSDQDDTLVNWFRAADRDSDGALNGAEMIADAERFFARLDVDRDGEILPPEMISYEWETAPEIQVNSPWRRARGEPKPEKPGPKRLGGSGYDPDGLQGAARYALLNIPQPVAAADADFDRAVTLDEFRQAAAERFRLLDRNGDLSLSLADLQALRLDPREARRRKTAKGARDPRIGTPVPTGN